MDENCHSEVHDLHRFFAEWLSGRVPFSGHRLRRVEDVLHPDFEMITPSGGLQDRTSLLEALRKGHGGRATIPDFTIRVDGYRGRPLTDGLHLVRYREWQTEGTRFRGRLSSALFQQAPDTPNGVQWLHLHEVWLPEGVEK